MAISDRGFASMDPARVRELASQAGKAAHEKGTARQWTRDQAIEAGRKGRAEMRKKRGTDGDDSERVDR